jgi:hypothetical protein
MRSFPMRERRAAAGASRLVDWTFVAFYALMTSLLAWRILHMQPATAAEAARLLQWTFWMGFVWLLATLAFVAVAWTRLAARKAPPPGHG